VAAVATVVEQQCSAFSARLDRVIADLEHRQQALVALVDRHVDESLARLSRLEAAMRFPGGKPPEPPARH
jgi:hypothetical protein